MPKFLFALTGCVFTAVLLMASIAHAQDQYPAQSPHEVVHQQDIQESFAKLPLAFEENQGQANPAVKFLSRGPGYQLFLTAQEAVMVFSSGGERSSNEESTRSKIPQAKQGVIHMRFEGASATPAVKGFEPLTFKTNYFVGTDSTQKFIDITNHSRVKYTSIYPGVDLVYYGNQQQLEYDLIVAPKADTTKIKLRFGGTHKLAITPEGDLKLGDSANDIAFRKPVAYQNIGGERHAVEAEYVLAANNQVSFKLGKYDTSFPLVIDPVLNYATFLWGTIGGIAVDSLGNIYVSGSISTKNLPVVGGYKTSQVGTVDAYVVKLNPSFVPIYATYLGARSAVTSGGGVAVDGAGNAYVTGTTNSGSYPVTAGAYQTTASTNGGAFITKLNAAGNALAYSTFVTGVTPKTIVVDSSGNAYVAGSVTSLYGAFKTSPGAFRTGYSGGFVAKLNSSGSAMVYASFLGGVSTSDVCNAIAIDAQGNAYVVGTTYSTDFPTTTPYQATLSGPIDAFVSKIDPTGTTLIYSTYLGGSNKEYGRGIAVDAAGQAYAVGMTNSSDYPITAGVFQPRIGYPDPSVTNAFITKFSSGGTALVYSSYLGGAWCLKPGVYSCFGLFNPGDGVDAGTSVVVDGGGYAYIGGYATSNLFPLVDSIKPDNISNSDVLSAPFIAKITPNGDSKIYSTVFDSRSQDQSVAGLTIDSNGNVYAIGNAAYSGYAPLPPITAGAQLTSGISFLVKLSNGIYTTSVQSSLNPAVYRSDLMYSR